MSAIFKYFCLLLTFLACHCHCIEYMPWFTRDKQLISQATYMSRYYRSVNTANGNVKKIVADHLASLGFTVSPKPRWSGSLEASVGYNNDQSAYFESMALAATYLFLNDIIGDPVSLGTGLTFDVPSKHSLRNLNTPHHGDVELVAHITIGKELTSGKSWTSRYWSVFGYGGANKGSPLTQGLLACEKNFHDKFQIRLYCRGLMGLGSHDLVDIDSFKGYGSIRHKSVDAGLRYTRSFPLVGNFFAEYACRLYGHNTTRKEHMLYLSFLFPIDLVPSLEDIHKKW